MAKKGQIGHAKVWLRYFSITRLWEVVVGQEKCEPMPPPHSRVFYLHFVNSTTLVQVNMQTRTKGLMSSQKMPNTKHNIFQMGTFVPTHKKCNFVTLCLLWRRRWYGGIHCVPNNKVTSQICPKVGFFFAFFWSYPTLNSDCCKCTFLLKKHFLLFQTRSQLLLLLPRRRRGRPKRNSVKLTPKMTSIAIAK